MRSPRILSADTTRSVSGYSCSGERARAGAGRCRWRLPQSEVRVSARGWPVLRREFLLKGMTAGAAAGISVPALAAAPRAAAPERVNIVATAGTTQLVLSALMTRMGYFTEFGLAPNYINVADGNKVVAALISGAMDICPTVRIHAGARCHRQGRPAEDHCRRRHQEFLRRLQRQSRRQDAEGPGGSHPSAWAPWAASCTRP